MQKHMFLQHIHHVQGNAERVGERRPSAWLSELSCGFSTKLLLSLFIGWQQVVAAYLQQIVSPDVSEQREIPKRPNTQSSLWPDGSHSLSDAVILLPAWAEADEGEAKHLLLVSLMFCSLTRCDVAAEALQHLVWKRSDDSNGFDLPTSRFLQDSELNLFEASEKKP